MNRLLAIALALVMALPQVSLAQTQLTQSGTFTGTSAPGGQGVLAEASAYANHTLSWTKTGTVTTCTVQLESSSDGSTGWTLMGAAQNCATANSYTLSNTTAAYVRYNVTALSATGTVTINLVASNQTTTGTTTDGYFESGPAACSWSTTGTAAGTGNGLQVIGANNIQVSQISATSAGASTNTLQCRVMVPSRLTSGRGATITDVVIPYGVQTTALTGINTGTVATITFPTPGATETPSTVTPVSAGAVSLSSVTGNLATTTAGAFDTIKITLGVPYAVPTADLAILVVTLNFVQSAAAAQVVNTPGIIVHYNNATY